MRKVCLWVGILAFVGMFAGFNITIWSDSEFWAYVGLGVLCVSFAVVLISLFIGLFLTKEPVVISQPEPPEIF